MPGDRFTVCEQLLVGQVFGRQEEGVEIPLLRWSQCRKDASVLQPYLAEPMVDLCKVVVSEACHPFSLTDLAEVWLG